MSGCRNHNKIQIQTQNQLRKQNTNNSNMQKQHSQAIDDIVLNKVLYIEVYNNTLTQLSKKGKENETTLQ